MTKKEKPKSSDCNNWNHIDCYNSKGTCKCDCHNPYSDMGIRYNSLREERRKKKK